MVAKKKLMVICKSDRTLNCVAVFIKERSAAQPMFMCVCVCVYASKRLRLPVG